MAFSLERADVDRLFAQHGIAPTAIEGSSTAAAAAGGRVATIAVRRTEDGSVISLTMGEAHVECSSPPDEAQAASLVAALQTLQKLPAGDASFDRMLVDLLVKVGKLYADSKALSLTLESVHLHHASYHIQNVAMLCERPLHVKPRRTSTGYDRRATFTQRHRTDRRFPR